MPTMAPGPAQETKPAFRTEAEIMDTAVRQARAGAVSSGIQTLLAGRDAEERRQLGAELVAILAAENLPRAASVALALPAGGVQLAALDEVGRTWARVNPVEALVWAMTLSDVSAALTARRAVTAELVADDPVATIDRIQRFPPSSARDDTLVLAAGAWARRNADDALDWLDSLPEDDFRERLTSSMGFELAQRNPQRALELADRLPPGRNRWLLVSAIGQTWVAVDAKAALEWAQQQPEGEARVAALAGVETGFGVPSSRTIASVPGSRGGSSRTRGGAAAAIAARDDVNSPTFAAWLATQPPGMSREEAILEYVRQRGVAEPESVGQMLASLPGGNVRQRAVELHVDNLMIGSPDRAAEFIRSLPRSEQDPDAVVRTARRLLHTNRAAAEALLDQALLPPDQKEQLLREAPP